MFSATKFVAAAAIVALFGGFLLAGVLTTPQPDEVVPAAMTESPSPMTEATSEATESPDPSVRTDILPGVTLTVEEVEPGVFRVINDGVRDIASVWYRDVVAGHDGSIWLSGGGSRQDIVHLGSPRDKALKWPDGTEAMGLTVTQDGTVWRRYWLTEGGARLDSFEDGKWTKPHRRIDLDIESLTIAPDGTLWAGAGLVVSRLEADGWEPLSAPAPTDGELLVTPSGEVWVAGALPGVFSQDDGSWQEEGPGRMWRYRWVDGEWQGQAVEMDAMPVDPFTLGFEIGADGTVWFAGVELLVADGEPVLKPVLDADGNSLGDSFLTRFDGTEWQRWGPADGVPSFGAGYGVGLRQAPDGGLWVEAQDHIARFDGTTWLRFLSGRYPSHWGLAWDVAPDGSVWLNALNDRNDDTKSDLYVITPEAVAAKEAEVIEPPQVEEADDKAEATTATEELLSGMVTEEVEPGIFRVVNDGLRDLATSSNLGIVAGHDGGIWLLRPQHFYRLGSDEWQTWATTNPKVKDFEVAPDGTVWTVRQRGGVIESFDGEGWTTHDAWGTLAVTSDGTVWSLLWDPEGAQYVLGYLDEDGWQALGGQDLGPSGAAVTQLLAAGPDDIWALAGTIGPPHVLRFVDGAWQRLVDVEEGEATWQRAEEPRPEGAPVFPLVAVGPDGTFWGVDARAFLEFSYLVRFDGSEWSRWPPGDIGFTLGAGMEVAPDGCVWYASISPADTCGGVTGFDGVTPDHYLSGLCVEAIDITADGAVWLLGTESDSDLRHVYVITPETAASS